MSTDQNKAIVQRALDQVFNAGNLEAVDDLYAPDFVNHAPAGLGSTIRGTDGVKHNVTRWHTAFPDLHFTVEHEVAEGDLVVSHWTARGTHLGPLSGSPPSGREVTVRAIELSRLAANRIVEQWLLWDAADLLGELGGR
jgi:steroid delta-isomerase-like uncharacterized protein